MLYEVEGFLRATGEEGRARAVMIRFKEEASNVRRPAVPSAKPTGTSTIPARSTLRAEGVSSVTDATYHIQRTRQCNRDDRHCPKDRQKKIMKESHSRNKIDPHDTRPAVRFLEICILQTTAVIKIILRRTKIIGTSSISTLSK